MKSQRNGLEPQQKVYFKCKFCGKVFDDKEEAERHGVACNMEFEVIKTSGVNHERERMV